jgi:uncharacterized protein (TIGR00369 family)
MSLQGKTVKETSVIMSQVMMPQDINKSGNVHGGVIMKLIDQVASVVAVRHARSNVVTASIDRMDFLSPVFVGDLVTCKSSLNYAGRTSMEIGVRVESENLLTGECRHTVSAYLTFVSLDSTGHPKEIPPLILETEENKRRNAQAQARRDLRLRERQNEKAARPETKPGC